MLPRISSTRLSEQKVSFLKLLCAIGFGCLMAWVAGDDFTLAQRVMIGIFISAAGLWITEAVPPFATAIGVIVASVFMLGAPGAAMGFSGARDYLVFLEPIIDPVMVMFFGGCVLALAVQKTELDQLMARWFLRPFARTTDFFLLGMILITGIFSMFMSNTATTLLMVTLLTPILKRLEQGGSFSRVLVLSVAFASNIGGMGTIIGSPPNAIAVAALQKQGIEITFGEWMIVGMPLAVGLLFVLWRLLMVVYRLEGARFEFPEKNLIKHDKSFKKTIAVGVVFLITILLWMMEGLHGWSAGMVALVPFCLFTMSGILVAEDLKRIPWDVLILVAGGLILGTGLQKTGLAQKLLEWIPLDNERLGLLMILIVLATVTLSNFMSNTSAATIVLPLALSLSAGSSILMALGVAFAASLAMSLPISTPPNAIAYGTGLIPSREMLRYGTLCTLAGVVVLFFVIYFLGGWIEGVLGD